MGTGDHLLAANGIRAIEAYAIETDGPTQHRELPSLEPTLMFNIGDPISIVDASGNTLGVGSGEAFFAGLHHRHCFSRSGGSQAGVHIRLSTVAAWRLLGAGVASCTDRAFLLGDVADKRLMSAIASHCPVTSLRGKESVGEILGSALAEAASTPLEIAWAMARLTRPGATVADVASDLGWSRRRPFERVRGITGMAPKTVIRIARYQRLLRDITDDKQVSWAERAVDAGYFDQSHMIREFTEFAGQTPGQFLSEA